MRSPYALLAALLVASPVGAQQPVPAAQNPSPMAEHTRAHERLASASPAGIVRTFAGPGAKPVELFVPERARDERTVDLVIHFHGASYVANQAVAALDRPVVAVALNLGSGSGVYHRAFVNGAAFDSLLAQIQAELKSAVGHDVAIGRLTLTAWSAGHGSVRAILLDVRHFARVHDILLIDGMHTSYVPEGVVVDKGGALDTTNLVAFRDFARAAMRGEKRLLVTHSEIFPGTFASTTETADWLIAALGLKRAPVLKWGPRGTQQLSEVASGGFTLVGFAGNSAPDHVDQLHGMPELLKRLLAP